MINVSNLDLWDKVEKTNPAFTKKANVRGNKITSISPQYQVLCATKEFGPYGKAWGFKSLTLDYSLVDKGLIVFTGVFFYPNGEFPILNSIGIYKDNAKTKIDDDFAKKVETDALTKALSKLGFNADIFMGKFDDCRYLQEVTAEFAAAADPDIQEIITAANINNIQYVTDNWSGKITNKWQQLPPETTAKLNDMNSAKQ